MVTSDTSMKVMMSIGTSLTWKFTVGAIFTFLVPTYAVAFTCGVVKFLMHLVACASVCAMRSCYCITSGHIHWTVFRKTLIKI